MLLFELFEPQLYSMAAKKVTTIWSVKKEVTKRKNLPKNSRLIFEANPLMFFSRYFLLVNV